MNNTTKLLIPREEYLASGIHIGMKQRNAGMKEYIYKIRPDGLSVLNLQVVDERIKTASKMIARAKNVLIVGRKTASHDPARKFCEATGSSCIVGRFMPGTLTNPTYRKFYEADVILIVDPQTDHQALSEAVKARIPIIGICDTFNDTKNIDLVIPANNEGKKSIATLFWIMAREVLKERGTIKSDEEFTGKIEDYIGEIEEEERPKKEEDSRSSRKGRGRRGSSR